MTPSSRTATGFDLIRLCDYARDLFEPEEAQAIREQLASSESSRRAVKLFQLVSSVARMDQAAEVPSYALRIVKAVAGLQPHTRPSSFLRFLPFNVTYDSLQAVSAGIRDFPSSHQRIVSYAAADFSVHVKVEQETNPHSQVVVGQLLHHDPEPRPVPEVPVLLLSDGRVVGRSLTSRFGEFQADGLPPDPLELCLLLESNECIDVPLGESPHDA